MPKYSTWGDRISEYFPRFNFSNTTCRYYANFMVIIAVLGVIPLATQCWKVYKSKEARDISLYAFAFQVFISTMWLGYALVCHNGVIVISSILLIVAASLLVFLAWRYQRLSEEDPEGALD